MVETDPNPSFLHIWRTITTQLPKLAPGERAYLFEIACCYDADKGYAWPGTKYLERALGCSENTLRRMRTSLEATRFPDGAPALVWRDGEYRGDRRKGVHIPHQTLRRGSRSPATSAAISSAETAGIGSMPSTSEGIRGTEPADSADGYPPDLRTTGLQDSSYSDRSSDDGIVSSFRRVLPERVAPSVARQLAQASTTQHRDHDQRYSIEQWLEATRRAAAQHPDGDAITHWPSYVAKIVPQVPTEATAAAKSAAPSPYDRATVIA